jgi:phosphatidylinositol 4-kinase
VQTAKVGRSHTIAGASPRMRQRRTNPGHSDPEDGRSSKAPTPRPKELANPKDLRRQAARPPPARGVSAQHRPALLSIAAEARLSSSSLPDFRDSPASPLPTPPATAGLGPKPEPYGARKHPPQTPRPLTPTALSRSQKVRLLRSNYLRSRISRIVLLLYRSRLD